MPQNDKVAAWELGKERNRLSVLSFLPLPESLRFAFDSCPKERNSACPVAVEGPGALPKELAIHSRVMSSHVLQIVSRRERGFSSAFSSLSVSISLREEIWKCWSLPNEVWKWQESPFLIRLGSYEALLYSPLIYHGHMCQLSHFHSSSRLLSPHLLNFFHMGPQLLCSRKALFCSTAEGVLSRGKVTR